ncbi:MAG: allantoinase [Chloroflexota bacterium]|jgi:peptidoglycan/xylan/chitin deacetylase (PgdA/CDA1 family)|nr:allantoinase [Chloroflexota bacterium]
MLLDHTPEILGPIPYRAYPKSPVIRWPNGARVAVWIIPNIEFSLPFNQSPSDARSNGAPDIKGWAIREYGQRVGVWRLMDAFDSVGARATVALSAYVTEVYPEVIEAGVQRNWEWMGHHLFQGSKKAGQSEDEERSQIKQTLDLIEDSAGTRPRGWLGPTGNLRTPQLLKEAGLTYTGDWVVDDRPYPIKAGMSWLLGVPYSLVHNDVYNYSYDTWVFSPNQYLEQMREVFNVLYAEGEQSGTVMAIPLHTHLSGFPARYVALKELLKYINGHSDVWWATGSEIADAYLEQVGLPTE